ncbi:hypothetical protein D3C72_425820 [compost metagenome]
MAEDAQELVFEGVGALQRLDALLVGAGALGVEQEALGDVEDRSQPHRAPLVGDGALEDLAVEQRVVLAPAAEGEVGAFGLPLIEQAQMLHHDGVVVGVGQVQGAHRLDDFGDVVAEDVRAGLVEVQVLAVEGQIDAHERLLDQGAEELLAVALQLDAGAPGAQEDVEAGLQLDLFDRHEDQLVDALVEEARDHAQVLAHGHEQERQEGGLLAGFQGLHALPVSLEVRAVEDAQVERLVGHLAIVGDDHLEARREPVREQPTVLAVLNHEQHPHRRGGGCRAVDQGVQGQRLIHLSRLSAGPSTRGSCSARC